jgi:hypothetical protein
MNVGVLIVGSEVGVDVKTTGGVGVGDGTYGVGDNVFNDETDGLTINPVGIVAIEVDETEVGTFDDATITNGDSVEITVGTVMTETEAGISVAGTITGDVGKTDGDGMVIF